MKPSTTTIDLIRHGQPQGGSKYRGHQIDDPLSEKGWQQMRNAVGDHTPWDHIISSPMIRCRAFAEQLAGKNNIPCTIADDLKEIGFGSWEGKTREQLKKKCPEEFEAFYKDPLNNRPAGAEPLEDFFSRVTRAYELQVEQYKNKHILLVSHAGVIRAIIARILNAEPVNMYRIRVDNAGISRIAIDADGPQLVFHNKSVI